MKTIGLLGGMSWESSVYYYTVINNLISQKVGGFTSAKVILNSVDFAPIEKLQSESNWDELNKIMIQEGLKIQNAGADFLLICTNTMHNSYNIMKESLSIPILHIADATAEVIKNSKISKIGLLGTIYTMEKEFYKNRLIDNYNLDVIVPEKDSRIIVNDIIYKELVFGKTTNQSKQKYLQIIESLQTKGAEGVILGCTEIPLLIKQEDVKIPVFDTTYIHAEQAVKYALKD